MSETGKPEATEAAKAYEDRRAKINHLVDQLTAALDEHETKMKASPRNWGFVGDLGNVVEELKNIVDFMTGGQDR